MKFHPIKAIQEYLEIVCKVIQFERMERELRANGIAVDSWEKGVIYTDYAYRKEIFLLTLFGRY